MTSIFEGQTPQNRVLSIQNKGNLGSRNICDNCFKLYVFASFPSATIARYFVLPVCNTAVRGDSSKCMFADV